MRKVRTLVAVVTGFLLLACLFTSPSAVAATVADTPGWLHTRGALILDGHDQPYTIKSVAWFGMETDSCAPHGLDRVSLSGVLTQMRELGFNTIRLPWASQCLHGGVPRYIDYTLNPQLNGLGYLQLMDTVINTARQAGLNVILDHHRSTYVNQTPLWYTAAYSRTLFQQDWQLLARRYAQTGNVIGYDLYNEPGLSCWGCGKPALDWRLAATTAGNMILAINPHALIIIEGIGREATRKINGGGAFWGGGLSWIRKAPVRLHVAHQLVYSTHEYGPSELLNAHYDLLPCFLSKHYQQTLPRVYDASFGYLMEHNIAPVFVGEIGFTNQRPADNTWANVTITYLREHHISFSYWALNGNATLPAVYGLYNTSWSNLNGYQLNQVKKLLA